MTKREFSSKKPFIQLFVSYFNGKRKCLKRKKNARFVYMKLIALWYGATLWPPSYCQFVKPAKSTDYLIIGVGGGGGG